MAKQDFGRIAIMLLAFVIYIIMLVFSQLSSSGISNGIFLQTIGNVSEKYATDVTPAKWAFSIWGVIFAWQILWFIYMFTGFCRRNVYNWMYSGPILSYGFYISWIINNLLLISWLFLWDREQLIAALIFLCWITFTGYIVLFFSYRGVHARIEELQAYHKSDLWLLRILVHNGVAAYITWTTIATLINFAVVLTYVGEVSRSTAATVCLSVLLIEVIAWFVVENFFLDKYVRYTLTIYPVVILALSGNIAKNFKPDSPGTNGIFYAVLLGIASTLFLLRILLVLWKHLKPQPGVKSENTVNY